MTIKTNLAVLAAWAIFTTVPAGATDLKMDLVAWDAAYRSTAVTIDNNFVGGDSDIRVQHGLANIIARPGMFGDDHKFDLDIRAIGYSDQRVDIDTNVVRNGSAITVQTGTLNVIID